VVTLGYGLNLTVAFNPPEYSKRDPYELLTRGEFLLECLRVLEFNERYAKKKGKDNVAYDYVVTQRVLKTLFLADELMDFDWLENISECES
jgi:hypothetical protein